jgi:hypothetical protein
MKAIIIHSLAGIIFFEMCLFSFARTEAEYGY